MTPSGKASPPDAQPRSRPSNRRGKDRLLVRRGARWFDNRLGAAKGARTLLGKVFPDHWSFMIGELALYAFVVLLLTGTYLTFFFNPSQKIVTYHGSYRALQGVHMTQAYKSAIDLSFDVRAGLVMRIGEQHRHAVRDQHRHRQPRLGGDRRVGGRQRLGGRLVHHPDRGAVHLIHPDHAPGGQADRRGQPPASPRPRHQSLPT